MIRRAASILVRNSTRIKTFPKLSPLKFNKLWNMTHNYLMSVEWLEIISIIKIRFNRHGLSALIAIPSLFLIIKNSNILSSSDSNDHLKNV